MQSESVLQTSKGSKQKSTLIIQNGVTEPRALHFHDNGTLFIADQSTRSVLHVRLMSNGIDIKASLLQSMGCHTQVFGIVSVQNTLLLEEETEQDDDIQSEEDALLVTMRSGIRSARKRNSSDFVFY